MVTDKVSIPFTHIETILPILQKISLFGGLNDRQLYTVFKVLEQVSYGTGEIIFKQGEHPSHIYIIQSGKVKIIGDIDDNPLELIVFDVGHCFGETSVIGVLPHTASAVAMNNTELIVLSGKALTQIHEMDKEIFSILILNIAREACRRLAKTDAILYHYAKMHHN